MKERAKLPPLRAALQRRMKEVFRKQDFPESQRETLGFFVIRSL